MYRKLYYAGFAGYFALLVFALIFYRERILFLDSAAYLFSLLTTDNFVFPNFRYGAGITEILPLLCNKFSNSLSLISLSYSVSFVLYYLLCYIICGSLFGNYRLALSVLFVNVLFVADSYYWMVSELPLGLAFLLVFIAYLEYAFGKKTNVLNIIIACVWCMGLHFFHPLLAIASLYVFAFFILRDNTPYSKKWLWLLLGVYIVTLVLKSRLLVAADDAHKMDNLQNFVRFFPNYLGVYSNELFLKRCATHFYWIPILSFLIIRYYKRQHMRKQLWFYVAALIGYILLVNVSYPEGWVPVFYKENLYLPLAIIIALPFMYDVLPSFKNEKTTVNIFLLICLTGLLRIYFTHNTYTTRLNWERKFLAKNLDNKIIADDKIAPLDTLILSWGTPYEFWLLSGMEHSRTASIVITDNLNAVMSHGNGKKLFITPWKNYDYNTLPSAFFAFRDTVSEYKEPKAIHD